MKHHQSSETDPRLANERGALVAARVAYLLNLSQEELDQRVRRDHPDTAMDLSAVAVLAGGNDKERVLRFLQVQVLLPDEIEAVKQVERIVS